MYLNINGVTTLVVDNGGQATTYPSTISIAYLTPDTSYNFDVVQITGGGQLGLLGTVSYFQIIFIEINSLTCLDYPHTWANIFRWYLNPSRHGWHAACGIFDIPEPALLSFCLLPRSSHSPGHGQPHYPRVLVCWQHLRTD